MEEASMAKSKKSKRGEKKVNQGNNTQVNLASMDVVSERHEQLKEIYPEVFDEDKIDFDQLRRVLGEWVEPEKERFGLNWPGKAECMQIIQQPSVASLKPNRENSLNFDTTENVFIEGDNLEVLKLLQKSYYGMVKIIYIDPPYNTGKEFVYPDKYKETLETYLAYTEQADVNGRKFSTNTDLVGRYHSNWLNMMYSRLYIAKNLLCEDGVIFISIDDNEKSNLIKLCDIIFGEENFIASFTVRSNPRGSQSSKMIAIEHEYIIAYCKNYDEVKIKGYEKTPEEIEKYSHEDERGKYRLLGLRQRGGAWRREDRPHMYYPIYVDIKTGNVSLVKDKQFSKECLPKRPDGQESRWTWGKGKFEKCKHMVVGRPVSREGEDDFWDIFRKDYLVSVTGDIATKKPGSIWYEKEINYQNGRNEIKELFSDSDIFEYPKPTFIIKKCIKMLDNGREDIILDFFAGSGTTAQSVMELNREDGGNRKFICVQLPEPIDKNSAAFKVAKCKTIADIATKRIRLAAKKIESEQSGQLSIHGDPIDLGFKTFKLTFSNFKIWNGKTGNAKELEERLFDYIDHIYASAKPEDILYELLLKSGFMLTTNIKEQKVSDGKIYSVENDSLIICLEKQVTIKLMEAIAEKDPAQVICLDKAFNGNDQLKTNSLQTFKSHARLKQNTVIFRTV